MHLAPLLAPATMKGVAANTVCACMYEYQRAGLPLPVYLKYFSKYREQQPIYIYVYFDIRKPGIAVFLLLIIRAKRVSN